MIIGVNGFKGSGKDTIGDFLVEQYGFKKVAFAGSLKQSVAALFDISLEDVDNFKGSSDDEIPYSEVILQWGHYQRSFDWREFLQRYGTEAHRGVFGDKFWIYQLMSQIDYGKGGHYVITDARFANELEFLKSLDACIIRVERPGVESDGHESEQVPPDDLVDFVIDNKASVEHLHWEVNKVMEQIGELYGFDFA